MVQQTYNLSVLSSGISVMVAHPSSRGEVGVQFFGPALFMVINAKAPEREFGVFCYLKFNI